MRVAARYRHQQRNGGAERGNLRQRQIDEDHAALDDVHTEIRVNPGQDEAGGKRRGEKLENRRVHAICPRRLS